MFGQIDIESLFLKRSGVIYDTTNKKKNLPPELTEFILVLHWVLLLTYHPVSTDVQYKLDICDGSSTDVLMNDGTNEQMRTYKQLVEY